MKKEFRSFTSARKFIQKLNLNGWNDWLEYCRSGNRPDDIPASPNKTYKNKGWISYGDFLGTGRIANQDRIMKSFKDAKKFVRELKLKNKDESITKVVVSRIKKATFKNKILLFNIFNNLVSKNTDNMNFLYSIDDDINIIGSSPELIISKNGIKIKSESIAGTNYQTTTNDFTTNKKEIIEQKIVTK